MINLIQPITVQQAYDGITHARRWASWNWWWRMVDDDEEWRPPSSEPQTDSRSALLMKNWRWRQLLVVKRDESFSLFFSLKIGIYSVRVEVCGATKWYNSPGRTRRGGRALVGCAHPGAPLVQVLAPEILIIDIKNPRRDSFHSENFYFCTKITPWQFC